MSDQTTKAQAFKALHVPGTPIILYNIWDPGSAQAVIDAGAKAVATGSHGVANAWGYEDGEQIPLNDVIANTKRIVEVAGDLPVTMDVETGYGVTSEAVGESIRKVITAGVIGINIEDQLLGQNQLRSLDNQVARLKAARQAADQLPLFINARSDIFKNMDPATHDSAVLTEALARAEAFAEAGADGFFVPGLRDIELIQQLCARSPLPVNIIWLDGMVDPSELAAAGVARISYGPGPYLKMIAWLKAQAEIALA